MWRTLKYDFSQYYLLFAFVTTYTHWPQTSTALLQSLLHSFMISVPQKAINIGHLHQRQPGDITIQWPPWIYKSWVYLIFIQSLVKFQHELQLQIKAAQSRKILPIWSFPQKKGTKSHSSIFHFCWKSYVSIPTSFSIFEHVTNLRKTFWDWTVFTFNMPVSYLLEHKSGYWKALAPHLS